MDGAPSHRASGPGAAIVAGKEIAAGPVRAGPVVIFRAAGEIVTTGPGGGGIWAVRRVTAGPVRGSMAWRAGRAVRVSQQDGEDLADGGFPGAGLGQRQVRLDLVAVAAAVFLLDHITGLGEVSDDAVGAALGDAQAGRDVAQPRARVMRDAQQDPGVIGQETPVRHAP